MTRNTMKWQKVVSIRKISVLWIHIFTNFNTYDELLLNMYNKGSCRGCGNSLVPSATCSICKEYVYWICNNCDGTEQVLHSHKLL